MDDKVLYKAIKSRKEDKILEAFDYIYTKYYKLIYFIISQYITNEFDIEDITQNVFVNFFNNLNKIDLTKNIKYYLVTSAKNQTINFLKKNKKIEYDEEIILNMKDEGSSNLLYNELIADLNKFLSREEINIILLHTLECYTFKEIAKKLNKKTNTIITIYNRAIKKYQNYKGE